MITRITDMDKLSTPTKPRFRRYSSEVRAAMLIEAGLACLAKGGILGFTIDNICAEAGASRGLVTHHFGSKDGLLAAVYAAIYERTLTYFTDAQGREPDLAGLIDTLFSDTIFDRDSLNIWLALWGSISTNPALRSEHRKRYALYRDAIARAIDAHCATRDRKVDSQSIAVLCISLFDGLWLEQCIDPELLSPARAKAACYQMLEPLIGPIHSLT
jgi:AcrR family transcriptional regulator